MYQPMERGEFHSAIFKSVWQIQKVLELAANKLFIQYNNKDTVKK
jgi:hypothetical protein